MAVGFKLRETFQTVSINLRTDPSRARNVRLRHLNQLISQSITRINYRIREYRRAEYLRTRPFGRTNERISCCAVIFVLPMPIYWTVPIRRM